MHGENCAKAHLSRDETSLDDVFLDPSSTSTGPTSSVDGRTLFHDVDEPPARAGELVSPKAQAARRHAAMRETRGGAGRDRTDDLKLAKLALSQLSYGPIGAIRDALRVA